MREGFFDFAFSYDYFWCDEDKKETPSDFELRLVGEILEHAKFLKAEQIIPVIHIQSRDGRKRLHDDDVMNLVQRLASDCSPSFIAIPERELGDGIVEKFKLTRRISGILADKYPAVRLHILGCGNLLSFAFLSAAGAQMFDGLEWYRTLVAENYHLHHYQQGPLFSAPKREIYNPTATLLLEGKLSYKIKVAMRNLLSLQAFFLELHDSLNSNSVPDLIERNFGSLAGKELRGLVG